MPAVATIRDTHLTKVCSTSYTTYIGAGCCESRIIAEESCGTFFLCEGIQRQVTYVIAPGDSEVIDLSAVPDDCYPGSVALSVLNDLTIINNSCDGQVEITLPTPIMAGETVILEGSCHFSVTSTTGYVSAPMWEITIENTGSTDQTIKLVVAGR
jgi:hypothetical protein